MFPQNGTTCYKYVSFFWRLARSPTTSSLPEVIDKSTCPFQNLVDQYSFPADVLTTKLPVSLKMILIIDNYDSFTFNLVHRIGELDSSYEIEVVRNDAITVDQIIQMQPSHLILSPGPCTPNEAGICLEIAEKLSGKLPILGVCLGHQSLGQASGGQIVRAKKLMHGKIDLIHHGRSGIFQGVDSPMTATRYHSLVIRPDSLSDEYEITAWTEEDGGYKEIMGIQHKKFPTFGVQFHPESFLSEEGPKLLENFLQIRTVEKV